MKNILINAKRIEKTLRRQFDEIVEKKISSCSKAEILQLISKNTTKLQTVENLEDLRKINEENATLLTLITVENFSEYKAEIKDTKKDFTVNIERVTNLEQQPIEDLKRYLDICRKEIAYIIEELQTVENIEDAEE